MGDFDRGKTCGSPISTRRLYRQNRPKADGPNPRRLPLPKGLEHFCRAAGMKVPLHTVLAKKDDLTLSDGRRLSGGELLPPEKKEEEEEAEDLLELPDPPPMDARTWKKTFLWQVISIVFVLIVTQLGTWYHEEELRKILANSTAGRGNDSAEL
ncbi:unnamed protein product [Effrenium voratum]|nr:unnamed protein product [Effrenium voratum]